MHPQRYEVIEIVADLDASALAARLRMPRTDRFVLLRRPGVEVSDAAVDHLVDACGAPMAASASPIPVPAARTSAVLALGIDRRLPPAPSLPYACEDACLVSIDALESIEIREPDPADSASNWLRSVWDALTRMGWRHVAAPGTALDWQPDDASDRTAGVWPPPAVRSLVGAANEGLATHQLWTRTQLVPIRVVIDGACITDSIHNGSQAVVLHAARALADRPGTQVSLAVPAKYVASARRVIGPGPLAVVPRDGSVAGHDVVYRPYQMLDPGEALWLERAAERVVIGQLDMIAFSNPTYHPSPALFHAVRNLQRSTMRRADAVTFISEFGRETAVAECPDLEHERLFVVSCGADPEPLLTADAAPEQLAALVGRSFLACTSATFWHKNRRHAIAVFADLCTTHGYDGLLVLAGPEPYYGRSGADEDRLLASLEPEIRSRVICLGQVDEPTKWWLFRHADLILYPSAIEGFGLVPFEAAAVGTPTLSYRGSAVSEVLGDGPATLPSWSVHRWSSSAAGVLDDAGARAAVLQQITQAGAEHTWARVAGLTWEAIEATVARPRAARFAEEGATRSRTAGSSRSIAIGARPLHFANRVFSYAQRRIDGARSDSTASTPPTRSLWQVDDRVGDSATIDEFPAGEMVVRGAGSLSKRAICTFASGRHRELGAVSRAASVLYADRWGWDVVTSDDESLSEGRPPSWAKLNLVRNLLDRYELVWLLDADALIVDLDRDVTAELGRSAGPVWMAEHPQERDEQSAVLNAGVMIVRSEPAALALLDEVWRQTQFVDHNWWENAALLHVLGYSLEPPYSIVGDSPWRASVSPLDRAWNAVPGYVDAPAPAVHHHARADHDDFGRRLEAMVGDLARVRAGLTPSSPG